MKYATLNHASPRWVWLVLLAAAELAWLAIQIQPPSTGLLSYTKGLPSIFITTLAVAMILGWARSYGSLREVPILHDVFCASWPLVLCHLGAFAAYSWLAMSVFEGKIMSSAFPDLWLAVWDMTGFAAGVFLLLAALPARVKTRVAPNKSFIVTTGVIVIGASLPWGYFNFTSRLWKPLSGPTFLLVEWLLDAFGQSVVSKPAELVIGTKLFSVTIRSACSGYEGIGLMILFVGTYLWLFRFRLRFPHAYLVLPCGILAIWLVNAVRMALLVLVGTHVSPEIAMGGFHSQVGWLGFIGVALGMAAVTQRIPLFAVTQSGPGEKARESNQTTAYLAPLMALLALSMITGALSSGFDWLYPARVLGTGAAIWLFWRRSAWRNLARSWSWGAVAIGVAVFAVWMGLERVRGASGTGSSIARTLGEMPVGLAVAWLIFRVLGSVVTVPIAEELAFRGYVLRRLIPDDFDRLSLVRFTWLSFLVSSVLFGALHGRWLAGTVSGMFYAWALYRRGRVTDAVIAHATTNALIVADVLILGHWGLWS